MTFRFKTSKFSIPDNPDKIFANLEIIIHQKILQILNMDLWDNNRYGYLKNLPFYLSYSVCPRSIDPFYIYSISYYIRWATTSWTFSNLPVLYHIVSNKRIFVTILKFDGTYFIYFSWHVNVIVVNTILFKLVKFIIFVDIIC